MIVGPARLRLAAATLVASLVLAPTPGTAADTSPWNGDSRSAIRLLAGSRPEGSGALRAGIEIRLAAGWHTYWRYPGDSGIPPQFDFAGSRNVKSVEVMWPAPQRIAEASITTIGYTAGVIFPLRVIPQDATRPAELRLRLDYAICEKMCVPAEGRSELALSGSATSQDTALIAAEGRVPRKVRLGEGRTLAVKSVQRAAGAGKPRVVVDLVAPAGVDLFAEGPTPQWALPVPEPVAGMPPGTARFAFELDGAPTGVRYEGAAITLTAVAPSGAIEVTTRLD
jgi:DsbC/DsbD-like thiol-disulfide interchange protein